jgi:hypothetical protein
VVSTASALPATSESIATAIERSIFRNPPRNAHLIAASRGGSSDGSDALSRRGWPR